MKKNHWIPFSLIYLGALSLAAPAYSQTYGQLRPEHSQIRFGYKQMGVALEGSFTTYQAQIDFDSQNPERAQARMQITLASIDTGIEEANQEVLGKAWFDAQQYPSAQFTSHTLKKTGNNRYELTGTLSIKDTTRTITAPLTFRTEGALGIFEGHFTLNRLDYGIGVGAWSDVSMVANEVQIKFHLVTQPK